MLRYCLTYKAMVEFLRNNPRDFLSSQDGLRGVRFPPFLKQPPPNSDKMYETMIFKTQDIRQERTVVPER